MSIGSLPGTSGINEKIELRRILDEKFDKPDLEAMCVDINARIRASGKRLDDEITLDLVGGTSKTAQILNLIQYLERRNLLGHLQDAIVAYRQPNPADSALPLAQQLVAYCQRRNLISQLLQACQEMRPDVTWPGLPAAAPQQKTLAEWTVMVYIAGDNSLSSQAATDTEFLTEIFAPTSIQLTVATDYRDKGANFYWIRPAQNENPLERQDFQSEEIDSGSADELLKFVQWSIKESPAQRYTLILWGHSTGLSLCHDDTSQHAISIVELGQMLAQVTALLGKPLDLLAIDTGHTANLELLAELQGSVNYMLASEYVTPGDGLPFEAILSWLDQNPQAASDAFAHEIVGAYQRKHAKAEASLIAFDVKQTQELLDPLLNLWPRLQIPTDTILRSALQQAMQQPNAKVSFGFYDLRIGLSHILRETQLSAPVETKLQRMGLDKDDTFSGLVLARFVPPQKSRAQEWGGIAVYLPLDKDVQQTELDIYAQTKLGRSEWGQLMLRLREDSQQQPSSPSTPKPNKASHKKGKPTTKSA